MSRNVQNQFWHSQNVFTSANSIIIPPKHPKLSQINSTSFKSVRTCPKLVLHLQSAKNFTNKLYRLPMCHGWHQISSKPLRSAGTCLWLPSNSLQIARIRTKSIVSNHYLRPLQYLDVSQINHTWSKVPKHDTSTSTPLKCPDNCYPFKSIRTGPKSICIPFKLTEVGPNQFWPPQKCPYFAQITLIPCKTAVNVSNQVLPLPECSNVSKVSTNPLPKYPKLSKIKFNFP